MVFWNVTPVVWRERDVSEEHIAFIFNIRLHLASAGFYLGLFCDPEDGGDVLLRRVGLSPDYTVLHSRKPYSS
jgi:hypothetical protein